MPRLNQIDITGLPTLHSAGVALQRFPNYQETSLGPHTLNCVLFTCLVRGSAVHQMDDQTLHVGPGSVGITHYGQSHVLLTGREGVDVINVYADLQSHPLPVVPPPWDRTLASTLAPHPSVVHRHNRRVHLVFDQPQRMIEPLQWMLREQHAAAPACVQIMQQLFSLFLVECCRVADRQGWQAQPKAPPWVEQVRAFIDHSFDRPIGLADMTRLAGVSSEHLCRRFRQHTALSPIAYLNDRRLQHAMWLLRTSDRSVTDIALASGFSDVSYFNRRFKTATGRTPTAFRRGNRYERTPPLPA